MSLDDRVADEPQATCELFGDYFSSIYKISSTRYDDRDFSYNGSVGMFSIHISAEEVEAKLQSLDGSNGPGPDGIPARVLKA